MNKKPLIQVRKDLHTSCSMSNKYVKKNILVLSNENVNTSGCSKTLINKEKHLNTMPFKQETLKDDSIECQNIQYKHKSKCLNETIFSPLNAPNVSPNLSVEQYSAPILTEPSSSSTASKWKLFWKNKKTSSQKVENTNKVIEKNERYRTRAISKKENNVNFSRKRKQDNVSIESNKKMCNDREQIINPSINDPMVSIVIVYL